MPLSSGIGQFIVVLSLLIVESNPQFVVKELEACCHHYIHLKCKDTEKIAIIQSRYIVTPVGPKAKATTIRSGREGSAGPVKTNATELDSTQSPYLSLWDMDIQFAHNIKFPSIKHDYTRLNTPDWAVAHRAIPRPYGYTPSDPLSTGLKFSSQRVLEMPLFKDKAVDKDTVWTQPLFQMVQDDSEISSQRIGPGSGLSAISGRVANNVRRAGIRNYFDKHSPVPCWSYETLGDSEDYLDVVGNGSGRSSKFPRPHWHYKDLRPVFNRRCSGRSECVVNLLRNKLRDQDLTSVCQKWPEGRILVKYLCFDSFSGDVHSTCNEDVGQGGEGFILNPGYPQIYAGDNRCQWRLQLPEPRRKILLLFLDISLRGEEKSKCRDQIIVSDGATKLLSTCGDHSSAIGVLSFSNSLNVTFTPESRFAFPKRGFLLYFRETGLNLSLVDPEIINWWPSDSTTLPAGMLYETGLPILLILVLFLVNLLVFLWIRHKRLLLQLELSNTPEFEVESRSQTEESTFTLSSTGFEDVSNNSRDRVERPRRFMQDENIVDVGIRNLEIHYQVSLRGYSLLPQADSGLHSSISPASSSVQNGSSPSTVPNTLSHFSRIGRSTPV